MSLLRSSMWLFAATLVAGVSNYGLQVVLGRFLSISEFGLYNALLGVYIILGVPVTTLMMVVSRKTSELWTLKNPASVASFFHSISKKVLMWGSVGFLMFLIFLGPLKGFLRAPSAFPVIALGLSIFVSVMIPLSFGVLQGMQVNSWFSFLQGLVGPARLILCGLPAIFGFAVGGVMFGQFLAYALVWLIAFGIVKARVGSNNGAEETEGLAWKDSYPVLIANFAFALITQMDVVLVNRFFSPEEASVYASAAVLGRAVVYFPGALVLAMFPMVSESKARGVNTQPILFKAFAFTLALSGCGALIFSLWPEWILGLLFGATYVPSAEILRYYGLAMLPMAILMILTHYFVARGNASFGYAMMGGALLEIFLIVVFHSTLLSIVFVLGGVSILLALFGFYLSFLERTNDVVESADYVSSIGV